MDEYEEIHEFLTFQQYPNGFSKNQKRVLRRRSQNHFRVKRGCSFIAVCPRLKLMMQRDKAKGWIGSGDKLLGVQKFKSLIAFGPRGIAQTCKTQQIEFKNTRHM